MFDLPTAFIELVCPVAPEVPLLSLQNLLIFFCGIVVGSILVGALNNRHGLEAWRARRELARRGLKEKRIPFQGSVGLANEVDLELTLNNAGTQNRKPPPRLTAEHMSATKFSSSIPTFVFGDEATYMDGLLSRVGKLHRSVHQEFTYNESGRWKPFLDYVLGTAKQEYPCQTGKGKAPTDELIPSYTRDLDHDGMTLEDFFHKQPEMNEKLTIVEIAVLRVYTGRWFQAINFYLRNLPKCQTCSEKPYYEHYDPGSIFLSSDHDKDVCRLCQRLKSEHHAQILDSWATSAALLTTGIIKLSRASNRATVYRGVKEVKVCLPSSFVDADSKGFRGGVELGPMSTTYDRSVAESYAGSEACSLFEIEFSIASRGASIRFLSQYPAEEEMLFPPGTSLTCRAINQESRTLRRLRIEATVNPNKELHHAVQSLRDKEDIVKVPGEPFVAIRRDGTREAASEMIKIGSCPVGGIK